MNSPEVHFIVCSPRSGSTWLATALNGHAEIFATEQRLFGQFCEMWPNNDGQLAPRITFDSYARAVSVHFFHQEFAKSRTQFIDDFIAEYTRFLADYGLRKSGRRILIDKVTPYPGTQNIVVERIRRFFPAAKMFHLIRDGRDVATSGTFDWILKDAQGTARHDVFVAGDSPHSLTRFFDDAVLTKWAEIWRQSMELSDEFKPVLTIRFEDMLIDQSSILAGIFSELGVQTSDESCARCVDNATFEKMTGRQRGDELPTAKQRSGTSGGWKKYFTRHDGELFQSIAGAQLIRAGYEIDDSWLKRLPASLSLDGLPLPKGASRS